MRIFEWLRKTSREKSALNIIDGLRQLVAAVRADIAEQASAQGRRRGRSADFTSAQQKLYDDLTRWSNIPPGRCLNEVILPALFSGDLVARSEPSFNSAVVAAYRVCEAAARQKGTNLEAHTPPEIRQIVRDAGDLYK
jgi:hypothetical protein